MAKPETPPSENISDSYISIGLGLLVVVVVGILLYNYFTQRGAQPTVTESPSPDQLAEEATMSAKPGTTYTVVEGDTLWSISEKSYGTGYNWVDIQKANNLRDGDDLTAGQQLFIPEVSPLLAALTPSPAPQASPEVPKGSPSPVAVATPPAPAASAPVVSPAPTITGTSYTVVKGDTLWSIACRAYSDCYGWTKIAQENKLDNPDLIHPGNIFTLPR